MKKCLLIFSILSCFFLFSCTNNIKKEESTTSINTTTKIEDDFLYYTVTFKNYDDSILKIIKVKEGDNAIYDLDTPKKEDDDEFHYEFIGWDIDLTNVNSNLIAKACFKETPKNDWNQVTWF